MKLHDLIRKWEGLSLKPYLCPAGVPTIGYGSTVYPNGVKVTLDDPEISITTAEIMMKMDAARFWQGVGEVSPILWFHDNKQQAVADFAYNLGLSRYKASTLRRRIDEGDWEGAAAEFPRWVYGGGKKLPGLIARRQDEVLLFNKKDTT